MKKEDDWLEQQRTKIVNAVNAVAALVIKQNLIRAFPPYLIEFDISTAGNCVRLRVVKSGCFDTVSEVEYWNLRYIFDDFLGMDKERLEENVTFFLEKMKEMERIVLFYSNKNKQEK